MPEPQPWMAGAACRGLTSLFFPDRGDNYSVSHARRVCDDCPVWSECLDWSMTADAPRDGVIAGFTPRERQQLRRDVQAAIIDVATVVEITPARRSVMWTLLDIAPQPPLHAWTREELLAVRAAADG